eukprot:m.495578 g.495578  ORF g.495578 m.495578 type:complete len:582 (+) comp44891_c0_seq1:134-1879(+)
MSAEAERVLREQLTDRVQHACARIAAVWDEIGLEPSECTARAEEIAQHVHTLLDTMATHEEKSRDAMAESVHSLSQQVAELSRELEEPEPAEVSTCDTTLIRLEEVLEEQATKLKAEKERRLEKAVELENRLELAERLLQLTESDKIDFGDKQTLSLEAMTDMEKRVTELEFELNDRRAVVNELCDAIAALWHKMNHSPSTTLEQQVYDHATDSILAPAAIISLQKLKSTLESDLIELQAKVDVAKTKVERLWEVLEVPKPERQAFAKGISANAGLAFEAYTTELERLQALRHEHMEKFVLAARERLIKLWDMCYYHESQRQQFLPAFENDCFDEQCLQEHEEEIARLEKVYARNASIFKLVERREAIRQKLRDFESRANDTDRLTNRGGALLREEKFRKAATKELPKVEADLRTRIGAWEARTQQDFMVNGARYLDVVETEKEEERQAKEQEKLERQRIKAEQIRAEMDYGSVPKTPKRAMSQHELEKTPKRRLRTGSVAKTPKSVKRAPLTDRNAQGSHTERAGTKRLRSDINNEDIEVEAYNLDNTELSASNVGNFSNFADGIKHALRSSNVFVENEQ